MSLNRVTLILLLLFSAAVFQLPAQQNEPEIDWLGLPDKAPARPNTSEPVEKIRARAEAGDAQSQFELANALYSGSGGVAKDEAEGLKWVRRAAEQNHAYGQCVLGGRLRQWPRSAEG